MLLLFSTPFLRQSHAALKTPFFQYSCFLLMLFCLCSSSSVNAQTFSLPETSSTGTYTISWSGANTYGIIDELRPDTTWNTIGGGSSSGAVTISRPNGTYTYRLKTCVITSGSSVCTQSGSAKTITVTIPSVTLNTYFTPASVGLGESATLYWSSINAVNCSSSNAAQVSGTSGSFVYTVPPNYSSDKVQIVITCSAGGPGAPATAAPILRVIVPTTYKYDELGRAIEVKHGNSGINSYEYDAADNRTKKTATKP